MSHTNNAGVESDDDIANKTVSECSSASPPPSLPWMAQWIWARQWALRFPHMQHKPPPPLPPPPPPRVPPTRWKRPRRPPLEYLPHRSSVPPRKWNPATHHGMLPPIPHSGRIHRPRRSRVRRSATPLNWADIPFLPTSPPRLPGRRQAPPGPRPPVSPSSPTSMLSPTVSPSSESISTDSQPSYHTPIWAHATTDWPHCTSNVSTD